MYFYLVIAKDFKTKITTYLFNQNDSHLKKVTLYVILIYRKFKD